VLFAGVVVVDLLVILAVVLTLRQGFAERRAAAGVTGVNLARLLETGLSASLDQIDLALRAVVDEHDRMERTGGVDGPTFEAFLARAKERTPDLMTLRTTDAEGVTLFNVPAIAGRVSLADRDFFAPLRDDPGRGLFFSKPYMGRIIRTPVMMTSRRLTTAGGAFAGVVLGGIELARLRQLLSSVDVGAHGILAVRFGDLSLVARAGVVGEDVRFGEMNVSSALRALVAAGHTDGSYDALSTLDGVQRTFVFRKLERYPLFVVVGLAPEDYLAGWRRQVALASILVACFTLVTLAGSWYGARSWRRRLDFERLLVDRTEHLRESEERFRIAFETSPDSVNLNRVADGVYVAINEGFTRMTGWTAAEAVGRSSLAMGIWEDPADRARLVSGLEHGVVENLEARFRAKDGRIIVGLMSARRIDLHGESLLLTITRDITAWKAAEAERDRLEVQFQQAQRLEGIGRLAGGVAHDFNNLLTVILASAESLQEQLAAAPGPLEEVEQLSLAAGRARDLTRQLLAFARKQVIAPVPLDLSAVVRSSEKLLRRVLGEDIALIAETAEGLWPVLCDRAQLEQVILNLAVNARDAMPAGGSLRITAENAEVELPRDAQGGGRPAGQWVRLSVRDAGTGMTPEVQSHLFEPFYTTKGAGKGTGLGLATVHGIVAQSGGHISVESAPGKGTTFEVYLPRTNEDPADERAAPPARAPRVGRETLLVLEDDPLVRSVTVRTLRGAGYEVLVAGNGAEAMALHAAHAGPLELVVADVIMPGLSGPQVVGELRRSRPQLRVLYVSGYPADAIAQRGVLDHGIEFLPKPFTASSLLERVRTLLEA
jgi:PAS domain S-box-containing protein